VLNGGFPLGRFDENVENQYSTARLKTPNVAARFQVELDLRVAADRMKTAKFIRLL
jgi:hypothetical protein